MISKRTILHIGLHKTGTTFLQLSLFPQFEKSELCYNPKNILNSVSDYTNSNYSEESLMKIKDVIFSEFNHISQNVVLLSNEGILGNPYDNYEKLDRMTKFYKSIFQELEIILVLRNQSDWLSSLYKQVFREGYNISINEFLNFKNNIFENRSNKKLRNVNALGFDYSEICDHLTKSFGKNKVHILFYEDLVKDPKIFVKEIQQIIKCEIKENINYERKVNRSFSAFSVKLTVLKKKMCFWEKKNVLDKSSERMIKMRKIAKKLAKNNSSQDLNSIRKNNEIKSYDVNPHRIHRCFSYLLHFTSWRGFLQYGLDRIVYIDWDLLGKKKRDIILNYYSNSNKKLSEYFKNKESKNFYFPQ